MRNIRIKLYEQITAVNIHWALFENVLFSLRQETSSQRESNNNTLQGKSN